MAMVGVQVVASARDNLPAGGHAPRDEAAVIEALYSKKAAEETRAADQLAPGSDAVPSRGAVIADVVLVKGMPGPAENAGGAAMSGADGEGLAKALSALGHDPGHAFFMLSRLEPGLGAPERAARVRGVLEAVDAELVIACDPDAAEDVALAFGIERLRVGKATVAQGRRLVALSGFEASLHDESAKKKVWAEMQAAARPRKSVY